VKFRPLHDRVEGSIVVGKVLANKSASCGFDAQKEEYVDRAERRHRRPEPPITATWAEKRAPLSSDDASGARDLELGVIGFPFGHS
jgi:hypothetical protein